jgi:hypothetical protein
VSLDPENDVITLEVDIPPDRTEFTAEEFTVRVRATNADGEGVNGMCILASGLNNSGNPAELDGISNCIESELNPKQMARLTETAFVGSENTDPEAGYATFLITIPFPGAMTLIFSGVPTENNLTLEVAGTSTRKFNVKP